MYCYTSHQAMYCYASHLAMYCYTSHLAMYCYTSHLAMYCYTSHLAMYCYTSHLAMYCYTSHLAMYCYTSHLAMYCYTSHLAMYCYTSHLKQPFYSLPNLLGWLLVAAERSNHRDSAEPLPDGSKRGQQTIPDVQLLRQPPGDRRAALWLPVGTVPCDLAPRQHWATEQHPPVSNITSFHVFRHMKRLSLFQSCS